MYPDAVCYMYIAVSDKYSPDINSNYIYVIKYVVFILLC